MKKIIILLTGLCFFLTSYSQVVKDSTRWTVVPTVGITGLKLQYVGGTKSFETSSLQTLCTGLSFKHYKKGSDYNLSVNGLLLFNKVIQQTDPVNLGIGCTVGYNPNVLPSGSDVSAGVSWDFNQKYPALLLNVTINLD